MTRQLVNAGFAYEDIPKQWLEVILAGTLKYYTETRSGIGTMVSRLRMECQTGNSEQSYDVIDDMETFVKSVPPDDIVFVRGVFAEGRPILLKQLSISDKERKQCSDCGIVAHCLLNIRDRGTDKTRALCNGCVVKNDSSYINDLGSVKTCEACTAVSCAHHPRRVRVRA